MATIDLTGVPANVTITNNGTTGVWIPLADSYIQIALDAGDTLKLLVSNSDDLAYFLSLETDTLAISNEAVSEG